MSVQKIGLKQWSPGARNPELDELVRSFVVRCRMSPDEDKKNRKTGKANQRMTDAGDCSRTNLPKNDRCARGIVIETEMRLPKSRCAVDDRGIANWKDVV